MPKKPNTEEQLVVQAIMKMSSKIDSLDTRLDSVDKTLVKQEANLGEHMRRTDLLEQGQVSLRQEIEPLKKHKAFIEGALKGIGLIATAVSVAAGLIKIVAFFIH